MADLIKTNQKRKQLGRFRLPHIVGKKKHGQQTGNM